jgi:hypothetical protein
MDTASIRELVSTRGISVSSFQINKALKAESGRVFRGAKCIQTAGFLLYITRDFRDRT